MQEQCSRIGVTLATLRRMSGLRARVRAELTAEIEATARRHLATDGPAGLSLRAIARELDMVSSAIYRYFPSRDDLLTALIIQSYDELGAAAEIADSTCDPADPRSRFAAVGRAAYHWARTNPAEYALIFGTPVPGYAAPPDTIGPATRFTFTLVQILAEVSRQNGRPAVAPTVSAAVAVDLDRLAAMAGVEIDDELFLAGMQVWMALFGMISFILFGQLNNVVADVDALAESCIDTWARTVMA
jgi:AcrR family transcriptional regulator